MKTKTKISFDIDGTLGHKPHLQRLAQELCKDPHNEVHIITRRYEQIHVDDEVTFVLQIAQALKIPRERIHFMNREYKVNKIKELEIDIHWDDDPNEIALIRKNTNCIGFLTV